MYFFFYIVYPILYKICTLLELKNASSFSFSRYARVVYTVIFLLINVYAFAPYMYEHVSFLYTTFKY